MHENESIINGQLKPLPIVEEDWNWAVRHIRALEAQVQQLSESILVLQKKVLS